MSAIVKSLYWDLTQRASLNQIFEYLIRDLPGNFGMAVRRGYYKNKFGNDGEGLNILPGAYIINPQNVECGKYVSIGVRNFFQAGGGVVLGDNVMMGPHAKIWTQTHNFERTDIPIKRQGYNYQKVTIGDDVWIGANAFIMPGTEIGSHSIVSACSVVGAKKYPEGIILAGNPARKIGERS